MNSKKILKGVLIAGGTGCAIGVIAATLKKKIKCCESKESKLYVNIDKHIKSDKLDEINKENEEDLNNVSACNNANENVNYRNEEPDILSDEEAIKELNNKMRTLYPNIYEETIKNFADLTKEILYDLLSSDRYVKVYINDTTYFIYELLGSVDDTDYHRIKCTRKEILDKYNPQHYMEECSIVSEYGFNFEILTKVILKSDLNKLRIEVL